eukprot:2613563-Pyramimonas_sp.AAC.1
MPAGIRRSATWRRQEKTFPSLSSQFLMAHFASAAMCVERYTECLHDGIGELYDTSIEDWGGTRRHGNARE